MLILMATIAKKEFTKKYRPKQKKHDIDCAPYISTFHQIYKGFYYIYTWEFPSFLLSNSDFCKLIG